MPSILTPPTDSAQLSAHFVYNSLNLLQTYIHEGDKRGALACLSRFSRLLRQWLKHAAKQSVPLSAEVELLEIYLIIERERFSARFDYEVVQEIGSADTVFIRPLAWHAAVEHALHAHILKAPGRGLLRITFMLSEGTPVCIVFGGVMPPDASPAILLAEQTVYLTP